MFIVDLHHAHFDFEGTAAILVGMYFLEDLIANDGDDTFVASVADHGVTFS